MCCFTLPHGRPNPFEIIATLDEVWAACAALPRMHWRYILSERNDQEDAQQLADFTRRIQEALPRLYERGKLITDGYSPEDEPHDDREDLYRSLHGDSVPHCLPLA